MCGTCEKTNAANEIHRFEKAGLGVAPFRFVGFYEDRGPKTCETPEGLTYTVGSPGQPMGTCAYCGTGIANIFVIRDRNGKEFKVGSECVRHTGDAGLIRQAEAAERKHNRELRHAREDAKVERLRGILSDDATRAKLAALPHPRKFEGKSALDYADWMLRNAGTKGRLDLLKWVEALGL